LRECATNDHETPMISDMIISHDHHDHWGGLPQLLPLLRQLWEKKHSSYTFVPPRIHKASGSLSNELHSLLQKLDERDYLPNGGGGILHDLVDDQILEGSGIELKILHTPGHTQDSICVILKEEKSLLTADTVLGAGTAIFSNLTLYMESLNRLSRLREEYKRVLPGHGPVVENGPEKVEEYIAHRQQREDEILRVLSSHPPDPKAQGWKIMEIVRIIYATYPENLWEWAGRLVLLHLEKLEHDGKVERVGKESWKIK
jgi:endoribonuclease LACTB2